MPLPCKLCMYSHLKQICMACSELRIDTLLFMKISPEKTLECANLFLSYPKIPHWLKFYFENILPPKEWYSRSKQEIAISVCVLVSHRNVETEKFCTCFIESWRNVFPHQFVILELGSCKITIEKDQEAILKPYSLWYSINRFYVSKAKGLSRTVCLGGLWVVNVCWYCRSLPHTCHMSKFIKKMSIVAYERVSNLRQFH